MSIYIQYWKKGWKVMLMMFCVNLASMILFLPIAIITSVFKLEKISYFILCLILGLVFVPAVIYAIFRYIYKEDGFVRV